MIYQELNRELRISDSGTMLQRMSYDRNKYFLRIENILRAFEHQELADCLALLRQEIAFTEACHYREKSYRRGYDYAANDIYEAICIGIMPSAIGKWLEKLHNWRQGDTSTRDTPPPIPMPLRETPRQAPRKKPAAKKKQAKTAKH